MRRRCLVGMVRQPGQEGANSVTMLQLSLTVLMEASAITIPF
jgi:hypothetical protein